jgi:hypothetical protein
MRWVVLAALAAGCGRFGFGFGEPTKDAAIGDAAADAIDLSDAPIDGARDGAIDAALDPALLVWLPMDDAIADRVTDDATGHGHHARCASGTVCPAQPAGHTSLGLGPFSSNVPGLELDDAGAALHLTVFTLAAWIQLSSLSNFSGVVGKPLGGATLNSYQLDVDDQGRLRCSVDDGNGPNRITQSSTLVVDQWIHVACTWDGTTLRLFRAGNPVGSLLGVQPAYDAQPVIVAGDRNNGSPAQSLEGVIDDVRIYNVALSAAAILQLAQ